MKQIPILLSLAVSLILLTAGWVFAQTVGTAEESYNLGIKALQENDTANAIIYYKAALTADANYELAYFNLGSVYFAQNNLEEAAANFKKVTELNPQNAEGLVSYAKVLYAQKQFDDAAKAFEGALAVNPEFTEAIKGLGKVYFQKATKASAAADKKTFYDECIKYVEKYVQADSTDAYSYYMMGMAYKKGSPAKAIANFSKAIQIDPNSFESVYNLAGLYASQEKYSKAIEYYEMALTLKPKDYRSAWQLAIAVQSSNAEDYDAAIAAYQRFLDVANNNTDARAKEHVPEAEKLIKDLKDAKAATGQ